MSDNIAIVTDTTADIPEDLARENDITVIPMLVGYEGNLYREGKEIFNNDVYKKLESGVKINTSAPSIGDFVNLYGNLIKKEKKDLIYSIHLSSKLSGTVNCAKQASEYFPDTKIKVIDSKTVTISLGFIVLEVARAVKKGLPEEKLDELIDILMEKNKFFATIKNFKYLFSGGRAPFLGKFVGSAIKLKPILTVDKAGKVSLKKFVRSEENTIIELYRQAKKAASSVYGNLIGIFYGSDKNRALELEKMIRKDKDIKIDELVLTEITTIMSAHTGPGIWGVGICPKIELA
ncbi:MAG: DegV family protein [Actinomycetota bacterium]|nr:DegV family protein [Actinomycetota bacterium]